MDPSPPVTLFTHLWLPPPWMCLRYAAVVPDVTPWVVTSRCSPCLRDAPISRCSPHIQYVLFPHRCVLHSLVANSQKCHQYLSVPTSCPDAPPSPAVAPSSHLQLSYSQMCILVLDMAPRPQMGFITRDAPPRPAAPPPPSCSPSQPVSVSPSPPSPSCRGPSHLRCPTQLCLSPPPDVHPSRPSPLTYPPRSGVHLPQCSAPRPGPALAPVMPRAASRLSSRRASRSGFHRISLFPRQSLLGPAATPAHPERGKARTISHRALREGSPYFTPFLVASRPGNYSSQRPPGGSGGADDTRAPPLDTAPPPPAKVCARIPWRELRTAVGRRVVPGVTRRTAAREAGERQVGPPTWGWETGGRRACPTLRAHGSAGSVGCRGAGVGDAQEAESAAGKGERRRRVAAGHAGASAGGRGPGRVDEDQSL